MSPRRLALALPLLAACSPAAPAPLAPAPTTTPALSAPASPPGIPFLKSAPPPLGSDRVAFKIFKFLDEVGAERDTYRALPDGAVEAKALFSYRDRMATVPLAAVAEVAADGSLRRYAAWGRTSRFTTIDDEVVARGATVSVRREGQPVKTVAAPAGAVGVASGYAPMMMQDLLVRAWIQRGRPPRMALLPEGEVAIASRGKEVYRNGAGEVALEHLAVSGLVWGREDVWVDDEGTLAAVVTRDAEFDHSEAVREGFEGILPALAKATGTDGVAWLAEQAKAAQRGGGGVLALAGGTLVDGTGSAAVRDAVIVVDGDRIVAAGPRAKVSVPAGATTIDVSGKFVLPGLWDMHAHLEQVEQGVVYLAAGVTTVRDMGNVLEFITGVRDAIDAGKGLGPRILLSGIVDGEGPAALGTVRIRSQADIAPTIERLKKAGCLEVKIYSSISPALVKPIVARAHAAGMRVVGHVPDGMTTLEAVEAGFDSVSHVEYLFDPVLPRAESRKLSREEKLRRLAAVDFASPPMAKVLDAFAARHVVMDDTVVLYEQLLHTLEEDARREPGIATLPRELEATLGGVPSPLAAAADAAFAKYLGLLTELHRRKVAIVAGTDISVPGHSLHRELELYVKAGMTPMEAIQAATLVPARAMRLDRELGTVEAGKRADLVVVDADPLADVANVRRASLVVARGKAYAPAELWRLVGFRPRTP